MSRKKPLKENEKLLLNYCNSLGINLLTDKKDYTLKDIFKSNEDYYYPFESQKELEPNELPEFNLDSKCETFKLLFSDVAEEYNSHRFTLVNEIGRTCSICDKYKYTIEYFLSKNNNNEFKPRSSCKSCRSKRMNKSDMIEYRKQWHKENKGRMKEYVNQYYKEKYHNDPLHNLSVKIRGSIKRYIKDGKSKRTSEILGCSFEFLHLRLNLQAYNNPHIDHIVPQSWANTEDDIYTLNHWSNFQILEANENISKGNRFCLKSNVEEVLKNHPHPEKVISIIKDNSIENKDRYVYFKNLTE